MQKQLGEVMIFAHSKTHHTCESFLKLKQALWTLVFAEGVEPTNNHAECCLRRAVLWQRRSFSKQSSEGRLFIQSILTAVATFRQQQSDVLDYLTEACTTAIHDD